MKDVTLYSQEGGSDKQYRLWIAPKGEGFVVMAAWGRRGGHQQTGAKSVGYVIPSVADSVFEKLLADKVAKGYRSGPDATPVKIVDTTATEIPSTASFLEPMLLNAIDKFEADKLNRDDQWIAQVKHDGVRAQLHRHGQQVTCFSRTGKPVAITEAIADRMRQLPNFDPLVLDGELVGETFHAFDVLFADFDRRQHPYDARLSTLDVVVPVDGIAAATSPIVRSLTATGFQAKSLMSATLRNLGAEGIVYKLLTAQYRAGRPGVGGDALKLKFKATASVIVASHNTSRSVKMKLADGMLLGSLTIPPNKEVPPVGSIVEVEYLYAYRGGSLVQAVYLMQRDDIAAADCNATQLEYKGESRVKTPIPAPVAKPGKPRAALVGGKLVVKVEAVKPAKPAVSNDEAKKRKQEAAARAWVTIRANRAAAAQVVAGA